MWFRTEFCIFWIVFFLDMQKTYARDPGITNVPALILAANTNGKLDPHSLEIFSTTNKEFFSLADLENSDLFGEASEDVLVKKNPMSAVNKGQHTTKRSANSQQDLNQEKQESKVITTENSTTGMPSLSQRLDHRNIVTEVSVQETFNGHTIERKPTFEELQEIQRKFYNNNEINIDDYLTQDDEGTLVYKEDDNQQSEDVEDVANIFDKGSSSQDDIDDMESILRDNDDTFETDNEDEFTKISQLMNKKSRKVYHTETQNFSNVKEFNITINESEGDSFDDYEKTNIPQENNTEQLDKTNFIIDDVAIDNNETETINSSLAESSEQEHLNLTKGNNLSTSTDSKGESQISSIHDGVIINNRTIESDDVSTISDPGFEEEDINLATIKSNLATLSTDSNGESQISSVHDAVIINNKTIESDDVSTISDPGFEEGDINLATIKSNVATLSTDSNGESQISSIHDAVIINNRTIKSDDVSTSGFEEEDVNLATINSNVTTLSTDSKGESEINSIYNTVIINNRTIESDEVSTIPASGFEEEDIDLAIIKSTFLTTENINESNKSSDTEATILNFLEDTDVTSIDKDTATDFILTKPSEGLDLGPKNHNGQSGLILDNKNATVKDEGFIEAVTTKQFDSEASSTLAEVLLTTDLTTINVDLLKTVTTEQTISSTSLVAQEYVLEANTSTESSITESLETTTVKNKAVTFESTKTLGSILSVMKENGSASDESSLTNISTNETSIIESSTTTVYNQELIASESIVPLLSAKEVILPANESSVPSTKALDINAIVVNNNEQEYNSNESTTKIYKQPIEIETAIELESTDFLASTLPVTENIISTDSNNDGLETTINAMVSAELFETVTIPEDTSTVKINTQEQILEATTLNLHEDVIEQKTSSESNIETTSQSTFKEYSEESTISTSLKLVNKIDDLDKTEPSPSEVALLFNKELEALEEYDDDLDDLDSSKESTGAKDHVEGQFRINTDKVSNETKETGKEEQLSGFDGYEFLEKAKKTGIVEMEPVLRSRVFNTSTEFSMKISRKDETFYVPSTAYIKEYENIVNITWKSFGDRNNSVAMRVFEKEDMGFFIIKEVITNLIWEENEFVSLKKPVALSPDPILDDTMPGRSRVVMMKDGTFITFSNVEFLKKVNPVSNARENLDLTSAQPKLWHFEIASICIVSAIIIAIVLYVIATKSRTGKITLSEKDELPQVTHC